MSARRWLPAAALAIAAATSLNAREALAQGWGGVGPYPPRDSYVKITPSGKVVVGQTTITLTIAWCSFNQGGQYVLDIGRRTITVNSVAVQDYNLQWNPQACEFTGDVSDEVLYTSQVDVDVSTAGPFRVYATVWTVSNYLVAGAETYTKPAKRRGAQVAADAQFQNVPSGGQSARFVITNTGPMRDTFALNRSCGGSGVTSCGSLSSSSIALGPDSSGAVTVSYTAGSPGNTGSVSVTAAADVNEYAWTNITVVAAPPPGVVIVGASPGLISYFDRSLCVTAAIGEGAAMECGDLRLAHAVPGVRTLGKQRTPTLIYNSQTAHPKPLVQADVTIPTSWGSPSAVTVTACLSVSSVSIGCKSWPGSNWGTSFGSTRRLAIPAADTLVTGIYSYSLQITGTGGVSLSAVNEELVVVNRSGSPFGAGWWLAGLEETLVGSWGGRIGVISGDGSLRVYYPTSTSNLYTAPGSPARPDTLDGRTADYVVRRTNGVEVHFHWLSGAWRHWYTKTRPGDSTVFSYDGSGCLTGIAVPKPSGTLNYTLTCTSGKVTKIVAPGLSSGDTTRRVLLHWNGARVDSISDPDNRRIRLGYSGTYTRLIISRTNQLGRVTSFAYDTARRLAGVTRPLSRLTTLKPAESRGVLVAQPLDSVYTEIDGPRTDVSDKTRFWVNGYGAPTRTRNALGQETLIRYSTTWPALADSVVGQSLMTRAYYNSTRGLIDSTTVYNPNGDGRNATTRYSWHTKWNMPTGTHSPTGLADSMSYDNTTGTLLWQQRASSTYRTNYFYNSITKLPDSVVTPRGNKESYAYSALGNVRKVVTPKGYPTWMTEDAIGRPYLVVAPKDTSSLDSTTVANSSGNRSYTWLNVMDRADSTLSTGPAVTVAQQASRTHPAMQLKVYNYYNAAGDLDSAARSFLKSDLTTARLVNRWSYDYARRVIATTSPEGGTTTYAPDPAGNVTMTITARGHVIDQRFDPLNRVVRRTIPGVSFDLKWPWYPYAAFTFPTADAGPAEAPGLCIGADTAYFKYDNAGNMKAADNGSALVRRSYTPAGALATETQNVRSYATYVPYSCGGNDRHPGGYSARDYSPHTYNLAYHYDLEGRRDTLWHPSNIAPCGGNACWQSYTYSSTLGTLDSLVGPAVDSYAIRTGFGYDPDGELTSIAHPGGINTSFTYDADGRLTSRSMSAGTSVSYTRDVAGRVLTADFTSPSPVWSGTTHAVYGPLGAVVYADNVTMNAGYEEFITDAIGNRTWQKTRLGWDPHGYSDRQRTLSYDADGRLTGIVPVNPPSTYIFANTPVYDEAGNTTESRTLDPHWDSGTGGGLPGETVTYHDAENRVRVVNRATDASGHGVGSMFEEYRYDALGRRVLVRMRCLHNGDATCKSYVERTVWDGSQSLYEMRVSGADADSLTFDTAESIDGDQFGRVMYLHGGGIDQPMAVYRYGAVGNEYHWVAFVPHPNWQGSYEVGTWASGAYVGQATSQCTLTYDDCPRTYWPGGARRLDGEVPDKLNQPVAATWWTGNLISGREDGSALLYRRNRYYDPATGRFTQQDPIGLAGGVNAYGFAGGDPVNFTDPFGLCPECIEIANEVAKLITEHYYRNMYNHDRSSPADAEQKGDHKEPPERSVFHTQGAGNEGNSKWVSKDGHDETVFDAKGARVTDPKNMGTYNFGTNAVSHGVLDVAPYMLLGNSPADPTTMVDRFKAWLAPPKKAP